MKEVLILGAGYAGLRVLKKLGGQKDIHITIVNKNDYHYQSTQLHEVAAGTTRASHISFEINDVLPSNATFVQDEVLSIDGANNTVNLQNHKPITYDYVVVALGFRSETFGIKGADLNALQLDSLVSAEFINEAITERVENYLRFKNPDDLRIVVCGAGFTGIELMGELLDMVDRISHKYNIPKEMFDIRCIEVANTIIPMFSKELGQYAMDKLKKRGAHLDLGNKIEEVLPGEVVTDKKRLKASVIIWTTGVSGSDVIADSGFNARRNRVNVDDNLIDSPFPNMFVLGDDSASFPAGSERPYPTTAQLAIAQSSVAAQNIMDLVNGKPMSKFVYHPFGTLCSLGENDAVAQIGKNNKEFRGWFASIMKKGASNKALFEVSNLSQTIKHGRFDLYH